MTGHTSWNDIRRDTERGPARQARVDDMKRAAAAALALGELRERRRTTQTALANALGTSQGAVSRIEHRDDLFLSTLREYVEALGGQLELRAVFADETVDILPAERRETVPA